MEKYKKAVLIANNVYWVGELMENDAFQCHAYLIVDGNESILIDSGSMLEYESIRKKVASIIPLKNIKYIIAHHQDPDVCANIPSFEKAINRDDLQIVSHSRNIALIKHYGITSNYYVIDKNKFRLQTSNFNIEFLTTPYSHAPGAFATYLKDKKILFSSDIFGAVEDNWHFFANENYFEEIKTFHEEYMPSQDILNYSLDKIQALELELIAPQHGSLIPKEYINLVINELKELKCGLYIQDYYKESLLYKNHLLAEKEKIEQKNAKKLEMIMDLQEDIITVTTDGVNLKYINKAFFKFTNFKNIEEFNKKHQCICELFVDYDDNKYLKPSYGYGYNWIRHIIDNPDEDMYAIIKNSFGVEILFKVIMKKFEFDGTKNDEYLVTFHDITPYSESIDLIDIISNIKGIYFTISDTDGKILKISDSLLDTLKIKNFKQKKYHFSDFLNDADLKVLNQHIKDKDSSTYEIKLRYNHIKIPIMAKEFFGIVNKKNVVISIFTDLTEIKTLQKESKKKDLILLQQSKMVQMGEMVSMIAHQWRQPLNAINAASTKMVLTKDIGILSDEEFVQSNEFIQNQCQRMSDVINTFLNYSKTSKDIQEFKVIDIINNVLELVITQFKNHNIEIIVEDKNDSVMLIKGHNDMLEQVIINLLMNARDAYDSIDTIDNKTIYITLEDKSTLSIKDYAGGISEKNQDSLFTPYFTTKPQGKGTGLGLYMSKRIMNEQFNGNLIYQPIENGTIFYIKF